ncbi:hypothetical protein PPNSA23_28890 [Phyllobacterium phragmitis]|uniref:Uncharacterized protein n=1 Tax=Phyllobacterium phragmitis TaxID=2670329 RepID=A0ABQ0H1Z9_9HYPH
MVVEKPEAVGHKTRVGDADLGAAAGNIVQLAFNQKTAIDIDQLAGAQAGAAAFGTAFLGLGMWPAHRESPAGPEPAGPSVLPQ